MSTSQLFQVTMVGTLLGQQCNNVFHYRGVALTDPDPADIAEQFQLQVWDLIAPVVTADYELETIEVVDIMDTASPHVRVVSEVGSGGGGATLGAFEAFGFSLAVATDDTRPGSKRLGGVDEATILDGVVTDAGTIGGLQDIADAMSDALVDVGTGLITQAVPVIVKRILDGDTYRLPETLGELVTNFITGAAASLIITSQNSRKLGRGA